MRTETAILQHVHLSKFDDVVLQIIFTKIHIFGESVCKNEYICENNIRRNSLQKCEEEKSK